MRKRVTKNTIFLSAVIFIFWISFFPEPLKGIFSRQIILISWALLILALLDNGFRKKEIFFDTPAKFLWAYLALMSVNLWFSGNTRVSLDFYKDLILFAIPAYFLIKGRLEAERIKNALYIFVVCAAIVSFIGFLEMIFSRNFIYEKLVENYFYHRYIIYQRMMSTLIHPNILGAYLITAVPAAYYFYKTGRNKPLNLAMFLLIASALFLTFSRGTWVSLFLMLSVWLWLKKRKRWIAVIWLAFLLFSLFAALPFIPEYIKLRFGFNHLWEYFIRGHRTLAYFITFNVLKEHPMAGIGLNNYRMLFSQYSNIKLPHEVMITDSVYLMHLAEAGITGFIGFAAFLWFALKNGFYCYKKFSDDKKEISLALLLGFMALLFNMASFDGFLWKTTFYLFWLFAGLLAALYRDSYCSATLSQE